MSSRSTTPDGSRVLPERIVVGDVRRPHGIRGSVLVDVHSDNPQRFVAGSEIWARLPDGRLRPLSVKRSSAHGTGLLVSFEGFEDRLRAEELRGASLTVDRSQVPPPEDGTYYFFELVGCRCFAAGSELGEVVDVIEDGGGLLLLVADDMRRLPIPFVREFLQRVDVEGGRIDLQLPPGLVEACASTS